MINYPPKAVLEGGCRYVQSNVPKVLIKERIQENPPVFGPSSVRSTSTERLERKVGFSKDRYSYFCRTSSSMNKEKFSVRLIDGEIKVIGNDDEGACSGRNRDDEETTNDENPGNAVQLLEKKQQKGNIKRNRDDQDQTTDDQNSRHVMRILDRQNRNRNKKDEEMTDAQKQNSKDVMRILDRQNRNRNRDADQTTDDQNLNSGHAVRLLYRQNRNRNKKDEETTDDQNSGHAVRLLDRENRNRNRDDQNQTTDDQNQNSGHEVRLLDRKKRRERLQEEKEKKAAIVRCFVFLLLFLLRLEERCSEILSFNAPSILSRV